MPPRPARSCAADAERLGRRSLCPVRWWWPRGLLLRGRWTLRHVPEADRPPRSRSDGVAGFSRETGLPSAPEAAPRDPTAVSRETERSCAAAPSPLSLPLSVSSRPTSAASVSVTDRASPGAPTIGVASAASARSIRLATSSGIRSEPGRVPSPSRISSSEADTSAQSAQVIRCARSSARRATGTIPSLSAEISSISGCSSCGEGVDVMPVPLLSRPRSLWCPAGWCAEPSAVAAAGPLSRGALRGAALGAGTDAPGGGFPPVPVATSEAPSLSPLPPPSLPPRRRCETRGSSRARPRAQRLLTVPTATSSTSAASATGYPCMSTSTSAARWSTGSSESAETSWRCVSWRSTGAAADSWGSRSCSIRSVSSVSVARREAAFRTRSRQAFTVMRCSQVVTADCPRKLCAAR